METFLTLLSLIAFLMFIIGMISPKAALFFMKDETKRTRARVALVYLLSSFVFAFLVGIISSTEAVEEIKSEETVATVETAETVEEQEEIVPQKPVGKWEYDISVDEMTKDTVKIAAVQSNNTEEFDFPYQGGSDMLLIIKSIKGKEEVVFKVTKGQFLTSFNDEYVRVCFDDSKPVNYSYSSAEDGSSDIIFLSNSKGFMNNLRKAKQIKVDFPMFQEGRPIFIFDVEYLE